MKRKFLTVLTSAICLAAAMPSPSVFADGQKVLTLGADLNDQQKNAILNYFGVNGQNIETLTITNQDERNHLGSYVPLEQIGTRTYSCALVSPTNGGGIQVKTANLSWVTSNMIASTLSTSGVVNCDVLAAAPFEVSGTGALTGILMAYESAVGMTLDEEKKEVATQELITTTTIANDIGQVGATQVVNDSKMQVIQGNVVNSNDIDVIINEAADEANVSLSEKDRQMLADLLAQIAQQDYEYEQMKETLERVEANMNDLSAKQEAAENNAQTETPAQQTEAPAQQTEAPSQQTETPQTVADDSILNQTNDNALGDSVIIDATDPTTVVEPQPAQTETSETIDIVNTDSYSDSEAEQPAQSESQTAALDSDVFSTEQPVAVDQNSEVTEETEAFDVPASPEEGILDGGADINVTPEDGIDDAVPASDSAPITVADMNFAPVSSEENDDTVPAGQNELTIYFQRTDIAPGTGMVAVNSSTDSSVIETVNLSDPLKAVVEPMTEEELLEKGWEEGTRAVVYLSVPLAQSSDYYVTLTEDAFMSADGAVHSEAVTDTALWAIRTSEYGFCIDKAQSAGILAGSAAQGQIMMDGTDATYACIENAEESLVTFDANEFTASGTFHATFHTAGQISFQVSFYDAPGGNVLNTIDYTVNVR